MALASETSAQTFDFESNGGVVTAFDDGHVPENLGSKFPTRLVQYPIIMNSVESKVHVFHDALPEQLVDALYQKTIQQHEKTRTPWGDYVSMEDVQKCWNRWNISCDTHNSPAENASQDTPTNNDPIDSSELVKEAVAYFLQLAVSTKCRPSQVHCKDSPNFIPANDPSSKPVWNSSDLIQSAHGVAVWALAAKPGSQVPYHLDYAEQVRYEHNIIVPPLLAGTLHCTKAPIQGGDFQVALDGLEHYQKHGYKTKCAPLDETSMLTIPYRYNQIICHSGELPHASTKIESITSEMRVIVGFNVFSHDIGPTVQRAPEHSETFRRKIQLQRAWTAGGNSVTVERVRNNKALSKLLVLAKREKVKHEYANAQKRLQEGIPTFLPTTVDALMRQFGIDGSNMDSSSAMLWPNAVDVQVYINQKIQEGTYEIVGSSDSTIQQAKGKLVSPDVIIDAVQQ